MKRCVLIVFFILFSIVFVRSLWLWLSRGGTQSCGRPPLQRMVCFMQCVCIHVDVVLLTHSSFSFPFYFAIYSSYTQFSSIGIYTIIYLELFPSTCLNKCARSWNFVRELLGKVASLITTTSIIPLAVRVIGIELLLLLLLLLWWDDWWCPEDVFEPEVSRFWFLNFSSRLHFARRFENQTWNINYIKHFHTMQI